MEFTGERYIPSLDGVIKYEHLHRYAVCLELVTGKSVLDLASGEGYGTALMAQVAESVVGVDIDSKSINCAQTKYKHLQNLNFLVGSCDSVPLAHNSVDIVISFETIEHHDKHEEMMLEVKRVLKPGGTLIISSPNRLTYSDETQNSNPFHVKELYYDEFADLLNKHFKYSQIYGQKLAISSFLFPLENASETRLKAYKGTIDTLIQQVSTLKSPLYFIALCSDEANKVQTVLDSLYIDESDDLLKTLEHDLQQTKNMLCQSTTELQTTQYQLQSVQLQLQQKQAELDVLQSQLQQKQAELDVSQSQLQQQQIKLLASLDMIAAMQSSKFWKLRTVWLKLKQMVGVKTDG